MSNFDNWLTFSHWTIHVYEIDNHVIYLGGAIAQ